MIKPNRLAALIFCILVFVGVGFATLFLPTIHQSNGIVYYLRPGISKKLFLQELSDKKIIHFPFFYSLFIALQKNELKTGEYLFAKNSTPFSIWRQVTNGTGLVYHPFTIVPGWSFKQLRQELLETAGLRHLIDHLNDKEIMSYLGHSELSPEGEFFPETYYYTKGISDLVILKRALDLMQHKLNSAWAMRATDLPYKNAYQALIAASLIEKEAYLDAERSLIAGVLINRLRKDMLLQFDPTVIYGLGARYDGKIHKENMSDKNPYNTYVHKGLPPTPIAMPSLISLQAALHPQENNYYYFVSRGDGTHQFSENLPAHHEAVLALIKQKEQSASHKRYFNNRLIASYLHQQWSKSLTGVLNFPKKF